MFNGHWCNLPFYTFSCIKFLYVYYTFDHFVAENTLLLKKDERILGNGAVRASEAVATSTTIAAIVTSLGGPPGAVGIVRLSGPAAVSVGGRVFRPLSKRKRKNTGWRPKSHFVEHGVALDPHGDVIDEV